jgi:hypothetical protein
MNFLTHVLKDTFEKGSKIPKETFRKWLEKNWWKPDTGGSPACNPSSQEAEIRRIAVISQP